MRWSNAASGNGSASADALDELDAAAEPLARASEHLGALVEPRDAKAPLVQPGRDEPGARSPRRARGRRRPARARRGTGASADPGRTRATAPTRSYVGPSGAKSARAWSARADIRLLSWHGGPRGRPGADRSRRDGRRHGQRHPRGRACARADVSTSARSRRRTGTAPGSRWTGTVGRLTRPT